MRSARRDSCFAAGWEDELSGVAPQRFVELAVDGNRAGDSRDCEVRATWRGSPVAHGKDLRGAVVARAAEHEKDEVTLGVVHH
jgi:hypothetical protein